MRTFFRMVGPALRWLLRSARALWRRRWVRRTAGLLTALALLLGAAYLWLILSLTGDLTAAQRSAPPATPSAAYEDVRFTTSDGLLLEGWLISPQGRPRGAVVLLHRQGGGRADQHTAPLAQALVEAGFLVLTFDGRGHGSSEGDHYGLSYEERFDLIGALDLLEQRGYARSAVVGLGSGGTTALLTAGDDERLAAVVADTALASVPDQLRWDLRQRRMPLLVEGGVHDMIALRYGFDLGHLVPEAAVARMRPLPLLIIHGALDTQVQPQHATRLAAAAGPTIGAELWLVPRAGHLGALEAEQERYLQRVVDFVARALEGQ